MSLNLGSRSIQYQICMFDKFGNTGGCQDTYTVIPSPSTPTCANVTFPPQLSVTAVVDNGPMSQYGWIDQVNLCGTFDGENDAYT